MKRIWTKDKVDFLKNNFEKRSDEWIADKMQLTVSQVKNKRLRMRLTKIRDGLWSEEDAILKRKFHNTDIYTLSETLDRSCAAIRRRAIKLGLSEYSPVPDGVHKPGEFNPFIGIL